MFANGFRRIALARGLLPEAEPRPQAEDDRPLPAAKPAQDAPAPCQPRDEAA